MAKDETVSVSEAVHKIQLHLLDGIPDEKQLLAAGSLISRSDYDDVVTERTISNTCGYPLCPNPLPSEPRRKGRYRISLKEHRVYDLQETYMFCSTDCLINSRTFSGSLQVERCSVLNHAKLNGILRLFGDLGKGDEGMGQNGDLGFPNLSIKEKEEVNAGDFSFSGPSSAIEGYVPQRELVSHPKNSKNEVLDSSSLKLNNNKEEFSSTIIMNDAYSISKNEDDFSQRERTKQSSEKKDFVSSGMDFTSVIIMNDEYTVSKMPPSSFDSMFKEVDGQGICKDFEDKCVMSISGSSFALKEKESSIVEEENHALRADTQSKTVLKSSLKSAGKKKLNRSVTWADNKKVDCAGNGSLNEIREMETVKEDLEVCGSADDRDDINMLRFSSAETCAMALSKAAEAVASGDSDVTDAVSEAGLMILPCPAAADEKEPIEDIEKVEPETGPMKWPEKPGIPDSDMFNPEDSWFDAPPEGFSLTLSAFAKMWNALFEWITSSTLAYVYGRDESFYEEYLSVNGREYPQKIVLRNGHSSEIKETLAGCISRVLPSVATDLRLPIPISTLEQRMGCLLDTMSFVEALPAFRMKQWQVIVLLFIDALSVCRIPPLAPHMTNRRVLLHKVLDGAHISMEEYEYMKDLIIPLGRAPHFSSQSGA